MIQQMKNIKDKVKHILEKYPDLRDNDMGLMAVIWEVESAYKYLGYTCDFLDEFMKSSFTSPESITRVRRKLQEQYPHLRGKKWNKRHKQAKEVQLEIKNL